MSRIAEDGKPSYPKDYCMGQYSKDGSVQVLGMGELDGGFILDFTLTPTNSTESKRSLPAKRERKSKVSILR